MIKRRISTIVIIFIGFILQTTALHAIELADVVPNILLILTVCYSYMRGRTSGLLTGFLCGLLLDMQFGNVIGLYAFARRSILQTTTYFRVYSSASAICFMAFITMLQSFW